MSGVVKGAMGKTGRIVLGVALALLVATTAPAQDYGGSGFAPGGRNLFRQGAGDDHDRARDAVRSGRSLPLGEIAGRVQRQIPGRLLDADLRQSRGGLVYALRWLTPDGNVLNMMVDAQSGRVLDVRGRR